MGLLAHQKEIIDAIEKHSVVSISAPRQNGTTHAAIRGAILAQGRTLFVSNGFPSCRIAFEQAITILNSLDGECKTSKSDLSASWTKTVPLTCERAREMLSTPNIPAALQRTAGSIRFVPYSKSGVRGCVADTIVFDDADMFDADMFETFYPSVFSSDNPKLVAVSTAPDRGLAARLDDLADIKLRWSGVTEESANPALDHLVKRKHLDTARRFLSVEAYRRECLGIGEGEWKDLEAGSVSDLITAQLNGQTFEPTCE